MTRPRAATVVAEHFHVWRIESPAGPESLGVCRVCAAEKLFRNYDLASWAQYGSGTTRSERQMEHEG